jgi:uncharacterized membrane protein
MKMPKKFDTNPLDPKFPEKARAQTAPARDYTAPPRSPFSTSEFPTSPGSVTEEETRRFHEASFNAYSFQGGPAAAVYQPPAFSDMNRASNRKEVRTGIPERWLIGLPYLPFSIGLAAGLIQLLVIPKEETKVRFHAAQGLAAHVAILIVTTILSIVGNVTDLADLGGLIFTVATTVMLIVFAIKAWKGKPVHIETVDDLTNWLEDKIGPIKS